MHIGAPGADFPMPQARSAPVLRVMQVNSSLAAPIPARRVGVRCGLAKSAVDRMKYLLFPQF